MYGQNEVTMLPPTAEDIEKQRDQRGVLPPSAAEMMRSIRAGETWVRYDSIVIGEGARDLSRGWFNTWQEFAAANRLEFFSGRDSNVGLAYTNQTVERTDWASDLYQANMEFFGPAAPAELCESNLDAQVSPYLFQQYMPHLLSTRVILSESDEILSVPANHIPSGHGISYPAVAAAAAPITIPGNQGMPSVGNGFKWISPIMLASKSKITVQCEINNPVRQVWSQLPGPGALLIPNGAGGQIRMPIWYVFRFSFISQRYVQMRGARSSA